MITANEARAKTFKNHGDELYIKMNIVEDFIDKAIQKCKFEVECPINILDAAVVDKLHAYGYKVEIEENSFKIFW